MKEDVKEESVAKKEINEEGKTEPSGMRQIIIETDGNQVRVVKSETAGKIELIGILETLISFIKGN